MSDGVATCAKGLHAMTGQNVIERTGDRAGRRECRACRVECKTRAYADGHTELNRVRCARVKAKAQGLLLMQRGPLVTLYGADAHVVHEGDISDVESWLEERAVRKPHGPRPTPMADSWAPWIDLFVEEQCAAKLSPGTVLTRLRHLATFSRSASDSDPLTVSRADLITYLASGNRQPRTTHSIRSTFRVFFQTLKLLGHRVDDPTEALPKVRMPRSLPRPCPDHVVREAYSAAKDDPRVALAIRIAVEAGLRCYEIAELRTEHVHGGRGDWSLRIFGKGGHERTVPINDDLADTLLDRAAGFVFPSTDRWGNVQRGHLTSHHLGGLIAAALPGEWTTHTLRHRFGTMAYRGTNDLRAVQELLGHASPITTAIYTKVSSDAMRKAAKAATEVEGL